MDEHSIIQNFLNGKNPGYSTVKNWIDTVVFFHGWGNRIDPDDVKQDALTIVLKNLRDGRYQGQNLKGYVQSISKNTCLMALRRGYRSNTQSINDIEIPATTGNPEAQLLKEEEFSQFKTVFSQLSSLCKRILVLKFIRSLGYREIGDRLDLTEGTARVRLFRCLARARELAIALESV